ncbi:lipid A biosynthesis protein [Dokdonia pacifica]|uniref:KDO2-lipid IV(A) lauroyltransferase n=1 Tax=Dokdonia pacifica TaxID=1627892 RepID=A0A239DVS7_9FLAO|nr:lysophospholipid acyltransferase family protein [Dokdonia pacifica]GGG41334.1 lipid A biosynthesis protein [Dokdonia pacifica]SNS36586.1 KDO2-lipid IV(A) lauroyltransferase [Dokdonia pacifica]
MQAIAFWLIYPLLWGLSKLPFKVLYFISDMVYILIYHIIGYRKKTVRYNLITAFPEKSSQELKQIEKKFYHHLCDLFIEMIKTLSIKKEQLTARMTYTNIEVVQGYEAQGKSGIVILGHYASYEWSFAIQLYMKNTGHGIYKKIKNAHFDGLVRRIRGRWNTELIANKFAAKRMKKNQELGMTSMYGFVADQSPRLGKSHYWTSFLGHELPFFTGVERISKELDLPIVFLKVKKTKRGHYEGTFIELAKNPKEFPDYKITDAFAKTLEDQIREAPQYYLWTHKRFKLLGKKQESAGKDKTT